LHTNLYVTYGVFTGHNVALRYDCEPSGMGTVYVRMVYY